MSEEHLPWLCRLCDEEAEGSVGDHFRVLHPAEFETWAAEPGFEVIHYEPGDTDRVACWPHAEGGSGELFAEGDIAILMDSDGSGINVQVCLDCFAGRTHRE